MKAVAPLIGLAWILTGCVEDWGSDPFPELADIPEPPERASTIAEKRAIAAEMAAEAQEDEDVPEDEGETSPSED